MLLIDNNSNLSNSPGSLAGLRLLIEARWPETMRVAGGSERVFTSGIAEFDRIFPLGGIPYGQLIEISGTVSSGKTSFLFALLASLTRTGIAAYIDCSRSFCPAAAEASGVDLGRLLLIQAGNHIEGVRTAELLLANKALLFIALDITNESNGSPDLTMSQLHRLRLKTVQARGLMIFLSENNSALIPASMTSLRLEISRAKRKRLKVTVSRSRICREGKSLEIAI